MVGEDLEIEGQPIVELATGLVRIVALSPRVAETGPGVDRSRSEVTSALLRRAADARLLWRWSCELQGAALLVEVPVAAFLDEDLVHELIGIMDEFELRPGELILQVTGTRCLAPGQEALGPLAAVDDLGVDIVIAADGDETADAVDTADGAGIANGDDGTMLAREFAVLDLVDGVETEAQLDQALEDGITLGRGDWLGRPTPLEDVRLVAAWAQWRSGPPLGADASE